MSLQPCILRVALHTPLRRLFDYLPPPNCKINTLIPGQRLRVPFGKGKARIGLLVKLTDKSEIEQHKLKHILEIVDEQPLYTQKHLNLLEWASQYYHHPFGEVIFTTVPPLLRKGLPPALKKEILWRLTPAGIVTHTESFKYAKKQAALLDFIKYFTDGVSSMQIQKKFAQWRPYLNALIEKGLVEKFNSQSSNSKKLRKTYNVKLNSAQKQAANEISVAAGRYQAFLLDGITGSGKTEVYIQSIRQIINTGLQALILLPEIGLTPQFIERFQHRLNVEIAVLHSALAERERLDTWLKARDGKVLVVIGTRSSIWTPFHQLGIIIVDEEHDLSYKQQDGFRYSARDMALIRAQREKIPVVLGSATPSMESLQNAATGRYQELKLTRRVGSAKLPRINILDIRANKMHGAVSQHLLEAIQHCINQKQQVLLFLNRRGYAPVMMCHDCGWVFKCPRCNIQMTYHKHNNKLCCHHCGHVEKLMNNCHECTGGKIIEIGHGTQRLTETLGEILPSANILRIDRDSTRRKDTLQLMLKDIHAGKVDILVGTQMLAKGHHFPKVTLVGIIDADRGLYSADYRASERMAQMILQVGGRAGRAESPGTVIIQTHHPDHPLLKTLVAQGYTKFSELVLQERKEALLPPFSYHALLRSEAHDMQLSRRFLNDAKSRLHSTNKLQLEIFGPIMAPVEKIAGRYRMQLLLQAKNRNQLRQTLQPWVNILEQMPSARKVRWSLDVDPQDMS